MIECNVYQVVKKNIVPADEIELLVKKIFSFLKIKNGEVSVHLIGDKKMKELNNKYRKINKTTDVLSFGLAENKRSKNEDWGDIFISVPKIIKQAKEFNVSTEEEFCRMLVHGILHLVGHDHQVKKEADKMFAIQEKILHTIIPTQSIL